MSELLYKDLQPLVETKIWHNMPKDELVPWIMARHHDERGHMNQGPVQIKEEDAIEWEQLHQFGFPAWIEETFRHVERSKPDMFWSGYWDEKCKPGANGGWVTGFPHKHGWPHGQTISLVVQTPADGGESVLVLDDDVTEIPFMPMEGVGLVIPGCIKHGVKRVEGDTPRLVLIATVYGPEENVLWK